MNERNQHDDIAIVDEGGDAHHLLDARDDLPLSLHYELDDLPLSPNAMRVYVHLVRRTGRSGTAWPSYASIGRHCFGRTPHTSKMKDATLKRRAIEAVAELLEFGLIRRRKRRRKDGGNTSNEFILTPRRDWRRGRET